MPARPAAPPGFGPDPAPGGPAERLLSWLAGPLPILFCSTILLGSAGLALLLPSNLGGPTVGLRGLEQQALAWSGLAAPLRSGLVQAAALGLVLVSLLRLWLRWYPGPSARPVAPRGRWLELLAVAALAAALWGGVGPTSPGSRGELELRPGVMRETYQAQVEQQPVLRFLGQQLTLLNWDEIRGQGQLQIKPPGGTAAIVPVGVGAPVSWGGWRLAPVAERLDPSPWQVTLRWRTRAPAPSAATPTAGSAAPTAGSAAPTEGSAVGSAAPTEGSAAPTAAPAADRAWTDPDTERPATPPTPEGGEIELEPGGEARLGGSGVIVLEETSPDRDGQGPAIRVAIHGRTTLPDRRWLFLNQGNREEQQRTGPIILEPVSARYQQLIRFQVEEARPLPLEYLGLAGLGLWGLFGAQRSRAGQRRPS